MKKVILCVATSLDAKIEGPGGEYDWCFADQDYGMTDFMNQIDTIFFGRKSYELVLKIDEQVEGQDSYAKYNTYVFSNTLTRVKEGYSLISGNTIETIKEIKSKDGKDIWLFGGADLTTSFIEKKLLDEIWLAVHPLLLGPGKPMFEDLSGRTQLTFLESTSYSSGLVSMKYRVEK